MYGDDEELKKAAQRHSVIASSYPGVDEPEYNPSDDPLVIAARQATEKMKDQNYKESQAAAQGASAGTGAVGGILGGIIGAIYGQPGLGYNIGKTAGGEIGFLAGGGLKDREGNTTFSSLMNREMGQAEKNGNLVKKVQDMFKDKKKKGPNGEDITVDADGMEWTADGMDGQMSELGDFGSAAEGADSLEYLGDAGSMLA